MAPIDTVRGEVSGIPLPFDVSEEEELLGCHTHAGVGRSTATPVTHCGSSWSRWFAVGRSHFAMDDCYGAPNASWIPVDCTCEIVVAVYAIEYPASRTCCGWS